MKDFYSVLGVNKGANDDEIKKAYRRLAKQHHPDVNKGDAAAEERFKEISEAYNVLSDKEKRKQYDMFGSGSFQGGFDPSQYGGQGFRWQAQQGPGSRQYSTGGSGAQGFDGIDLGDIFGDLFNMGGFNRSTGKKRPKAREKSRESIKGTDTYTNIEIDFREAINGTSKQMSIQRGDHIDKITVKIPAGVDNGSKVRIKGKGHSGQMGGNAGDLYLNIRIKPDKTFWREGADLFCEVPISIYESVLGSKIDVPTLSGSASMKIPSSTESGQKFRLKGKGAPILGKKGNGDQFVIIKIVPPPKLDKETKRIFEELNGSVGYDPRGWISC